MQNEYNILDIVQGSARRRINRRGTEVIGVDKMDR